MEKMDGMIERLKKGESITTKSMVGIADFHGVTEQEAIAVIAFHLVTGKLCETSEGYEAVHDGPPILPA